MSANSWLSVELLRKSKSQSQWQGSSPLCHSFSLAALFRGESKDRYLYGVGTIVTFFKIVQNVRMVKRQEYPFDTFSD